MVGDGGDLALADLGAYGELIRGRGGWAAAGRGSLRHHPSTIAGLVRRGYVHIIERCRRHFYARLTPATGRAARAFARRANTRFDMRLP